MKKLKRLRYNSKPKVGEFLVWKNSKGKVFKKNPRDRKMIGEIRRKEGKKQVIVGYINQKDKKSGKPKAKKVRAIAEDFVMMKKVVKQPNIRETVSSLTFRIHSDRFITSQIPRQIRRKLQQALDQNGEIIFSLAVFHPRVGEHDTTPRYLESIPDYLDYIIFRDIKNMLDSLSIRLSPKKEGSSKQNKRHYKRYAEITLKLSGVDF